MKTLKLLIFLITSSKQNNEANKAKFVTNIESFVEFIMKITKPFILLIALNPNSTNDLNDLFDGKNKEGISLNNAESYIGKIINEINPRYNYIHLLKYSMKFILFPLL